MGNYGVLVISHGSRDADWVALVRKAVADVPLPDPAMPLECAFLELVDGALIQDGLDRLAEQGVDEIVVVPLFISSGSTHIDEIGWALGAKPEPALETDLQRFCSAARIHMCAPIDDDPEIAALLAEKLAPLSREPQRELVLLVAHGSKEDGFHERWQQGMSSLAEQVRRIGGYAAADTAMLLPDQTAERLGAWRVREPELDVLVAPLFLSEGYFTRTVIPQRLAGYDCRYAGSTLLPSPLVTRWIGRRIAEALAELGAL